MMKKISTILLIFCFIQFVSFCSAEDTDVIRHVDACKAIVEIMCIQISPSLDSFPPERHYEVLSKALASKGIDDFMNKSPDSPLTIGEMKEVFFKILSGKELEPVTENSFCCPIEYIAVLSLPSGQNITKEQFDNLSTCFSACAPEAVDVYIVPEADRLLPGGPDTSEERAASDIL